VDEAYAAIVSGTAAPSSGVYPASAVRSASLPTVLRAWVASGALGAISGISHSVAGQVRITSGQLSGIAQVQREMAMRIAYLEEVERNGRNPNEDGVYLAAMVSGVLSGIETNGY
jgi:hypothetical protein